MNEIMDRPSVKCETVTSILRFGPSWLSSESVVRRLIRSETNLKKRNFFIIVLPSDRFSFYHLHLLYWSLCRNAHLSSSDSVLLILLFLLWTIKFSPSYKIYWRAEKDKGRPILFCSKEYLLLAFRHTKLVVILRLTEDTLPHIATWPPYRGHKLYRI